MNKRFIFNSLVTLLLAFATTSAVAWDSVGHRISAAVALEFVSAEVRAELVGILSAHPRYQEDFLDSIPRFVNRDDEAQLSRWLLGQAAYWPDIARGLPEPDREQYNRPSWHYTDGAWVRGSAAFQGNEYIDLEPFADIPGVASAEIREEDQVINVSTAIDYNTRILANPNANPAERAVALCWVLHLMGDIHQPLHAGALFSPELFARGDRGGNAVTIDDSNLHSRWDGALTDGGLEAELAEIMQLLTGFSRPQIEGVDSDWDQWLNESRMTLLNLVYSPTIRAAIRSAEASGRELETLSLDDAYVSSMQQVARQRLGLAGLRLAIYFSNELP